MYIDLYKTADLLIESVNDYLELFSSKIDFTAENAFDVMVSHYKEVKMTDFFLVLYPQENFILSFDSLYISLCNDYKNCLSLSFMRAFKFRDDTDETIAIRFNLNFDSVDCHSYYSRNIELRADDLKTDENLYEKLIESFKSEALYGKIRDTKPDNFELNINYNV